MGLKLKPSKCEFFKSRITYLGHIVLAAGIETDPKKIKAVKNWTLPRTVMDVHSFLGFTNHYYRFIQGYTKVARPLNVLISGNNANRKKSLVKWNPECQQAFDRFKDLYTKTPILAYAYGFPEKILSDQGRNFESQFISELCELTQVKKLRTTPYWPEGNGSCERFNRTLISMLGTLPDDFKSKWPQHTGTLVYAYNCTHSNATGSSPYYLLYG